MVLRGAVCDAGQEFALDSTDGCADTAKEPEQKHIAEETCPRPLFLLFCFIFLIGAIAKARHIQKVTLVLVGELGTWNSGLSVDDAAC